MSTVDSENIGKPAPQVQPKVRRKPAKKAKAAKKTQSEYLFVIAGVSDGCNQPIEILMQFR